ncbi:MAG: tetratricopeptide repeat protein [Armatimonadetes bacterium]|nr:tetratricopeptide repeat protein [Armatimonadota bacterium]
MTLRIVSAPPGFGLVSALLAVPTLFGLLLFFEPIFPQSFSLPWLVLSAIGWVLLTRTILFIQLTEEGIHVSPVTSFWLSRIPGFSWQSAHYTDWRVIREVHYDWKPSPIGKSAYPSGDLVIRWRNGNLRIPLHVREIRIIVGEILKQVDSWRLDFLVKKIPDYFLKKTDLEKLLQRRRILSKEIEEEKKAAWGCALWNRFEEAIQILQDLRKDMPDAARDLEVNKNLAYLLLSTQRPAEAESLLEESAELRPDDEEALLLLGDVCSDLSKNQRGVECYHTAAALDSNSGRAYVSLYHYYLTQGQRDLALRYLDQAVFHARDALVREELLEEQAYQKRLDEDPAFLRKEIRHFTIAAVTERVQAACLIWMGVSGLGYWVSSALAWERWPDRFSQIFWTCAVAWLIAGTIRRFLRLTK